jgi:hypothetical protein
VEHRDEPAGDHVLKERRKHWQKELADGALFQVAARKVGTQAPQSDESFESACLRGSLARKAAVEASSSPTFAKNRRMWATRAGLCGSIRIAGNERGNIHVSQIGILSALHSALSDSRKAGLILVGQLVRFFGGNVLFGKTGGRSVRTR